MFREWWQEGQINHSWVCISGANIRPFPFFNAGSWEGVVLRAHTDPPVSVCCPAHLDGSLWVTMGVCSPGACTGPSTQGSHHYWGTWAQNYPSTEPGILLGRSSNHSVTSKGEFRASSDLECDQLNMKKCLIKLTWKSLEGSWKLKARLPVPHSIWQSSRSPLATNAGLSLQRDVQPFHLPAVTMAAEGSTWEPPSLLPPYEQEYVPQGTQFHQRKASWEILAIFLLLKPGCLAEGSMLQECHLLWRPGGLPMLCATGIEALYSCIKENLYWTSKLL